MLKLITRMRRNRIGKKVSTGNLRKGDEEQRQGSRWGRVSFVRVERGEEQVRVGVNGKGYGMGENA